MTDTWNENFIARALASQTLKGRNLITVPRTSWTGYECDLLVVDSKLRIIDVEIKISRSDLKADAKKDKWWHRRWGEDPVQRGWPQKVYKHYYVLPRSIWDDKLYDSVSPNSGVVLLNLPSSNGSIVCDLRRKATPNKEAQPITAADAIDLGRHASLRMWDARIELELAQQRLASLKKPTHSRKCFE